jgi:phage tail-like protein
MTMIDVETQEKSASSYLEYLPGIYRDDIFMGQYLKIFEDILQPIENSIDNIAFYFDPLMTPEALVPWLASWLDLASDPTWTLKKRRELVKSAAVLHRLRGTRQGLSEYLRIYTGNVPEISEYVKGMILDSNTQLGINTILGSAGTGNSFAVSIEFDSANQVNVDVIKAIIDSQKPAHTVYTLYVKRRE